MISGYYESDNFLGIRWLRYRLASFMLCLCISTPIQLTAAQIVYVSNHLNRSTEAYVADPVSGGLTQIPFSATAYQTGIGPIGLAVDSKGNFLYVGNEGFTGSGTTENGSVSAFTINASTGALANINGSPFSAGANSCPQDVVVHPTGSFVYVSNGCYPSGSPPPIGSPYPDLLGYAVNPLSGALIQVPGSPFLGGVGPQQMTIDSGGKCLYVISANFYSQTDFRLLSVISAYSINAFTGALTQVQSYPFPVGIGVSDLAVDASGRFLYAVAAGSIFAYTINSSDGSLTPVPGSPFAGPPSGTNLAVDPADRFIFISSYPVNSVAAYTINTSNGTLAPVPGSPWATGSGPDGLAVDPTGHFLYVANNTYPSSISAYSINGDTGALAAISGSPFPALFGASKLAIFSPPSPTVTNLTPDSAPGGGATFTLTVNGTGFASGATVQWNGSALPTTFVSAIRVTASVTSMLIASAGTATVTVSIGGVTSNGAVFTIKKNLCDINNDGTVDVSDVQLVTTQALGVTQSVSDLNGDGRVNVVDVQIVINAALGRGCSAT